jgi:hypothetical protein
MSQLVFGKHWEAKLADKAAAAAAVNAPATTPLAPAAEARVFISDDVTAAHRAVSGGSSAGSSGGSGGSSAGSSGGSSGSSGSSSSSGGSSGGSSGAARPFRFISTFKWEPRKGWDILLEAYLSAFSAEDDVE